MTNKIRKHSKRCENTKPKSKCKCRCGGYMHGIAHRDNVKLFARSLNANLGRNVGKMINSLTGGYFECTCGRKIHLYGNFLGYEHDAGILDKLGIKWWLYMSCPRCGYEWSWQKILKRIKYD